MEHCRFNSRRDSDYCGRCIKLISEVNDATSDRTILYTYSVLCILCSTRTSIKTTEDRYNAIRAYPLGAKCGRCGNAGLEWSREDMQTISRGR